MLVLITVPAVEKTGYVSCYPRYLFVVVLMTVRAVEKQVTFRVTLLRYLFVLVLMTVPAVEKQVTLVLTTLPVCVSSGHGPDSCRKESYVS